MAVYEYECEQCTYQMSVTMSIKKFDPKEKRYCPNCGTEIKRKISPVGISFGRGFFKDCYESVKNLPSNSNGE